jgi:phosphonate transport system substrate-binding protein
MKKLLGLATLLLLAVALVGCGSATTTTTNPNHVDELNVYFVPSRPADEILTITAPLAAALKSMLAIEGFDVGQVNIMVSSTYEAAGQALYSGTADIAYLPGGTYV